MQKYARVKSCEKVLLERFMVDSRLISSQVLEEFVWWCVSCTYLFTICWVKTQKYWRKKDALFWYEWRKRTCLLLYDAKKLIFLKLLVNTKLIKILQMAQFYIQFVYKPHFGTWILLFGLLGQFIFFFKNTFEQRCFSASQILILSVKESGAL